MIACLYGRAFAPFVEPAIRGMVMAAAATGGSIRPLTIEMAIDEGGLRSQVRRLYILPFDPPASLDRSASASTLVRELFPRTELVTSFAVQDLCWDKIATQERLRDRGVPVPDTVMSSQPSDVYEFVREHEFAVIKDRYACAGQGHIVVWLENGQLVGDHGSHQYQIELTADGERRLVAECLRYPAPFYVQRLVSDRGPHGNTPPQVLRAYVVDGQIAFWTERYRDRYARPADWIVNVARGAKYRFVQSVSEEVKKIALRSAEVIGARIAAVDLIRTASGGPYVLEVDTDSHQMIIDRSFKYIPEYRDFFNVDRYIAEALLAEPDAPTRSLISR